jgi:hypothetical protein
MRDERQPLDACRTTGITRRSCVSATLRAVWSGWRCSLRRQVDLWGTVISIAAEVLPVAYERYSPGDGGIEQFELRSAVPVYGGGSGVLSGDGVEQARPGVLRISVQALD